MRFSSLCTIDTDTGKLVNLIQVDAMKIYYTMQQVTMVINFPVMLIFGFYTMYEMIGLTFLAGFVVVLTKEEVVENRKWSVSRM